MRVAAIILAFFMSGAANAAEEGEEKEKEEKEESLDDEFSLQSDDYFPDLVAKDEEGGIIDEFAFLQEEDIVYTAAKHRQKIGFSPSAVILITRKDIEESGALTLMELLRRYPVIHVYTFTPAQTTAEVRGTARVLLIVDGLETNIELYEKPLYAIMPVGLNEIERIEIVLGPNSALYGADAISAVINIITRIPSSDLGADLQLSAGERGTLILEGLVEDGVGPVSARGSFGIDQANSWMDRNFLSRDILRANAVIRLDLNDGFLTANGGVVSGAGRIFGVIGNLDFQKFLFTNLGARLQLGDLEVRAYWYGVRAKLNVDVGLVHPDLGVTLGTIPVVDFAGDTCHLGAQYDIEPFRNNLLIVGADFRHTGFQSEQIVDAEVRESRVGLFFHDEHWFLDKILVTLGARVDWNSQTDLALSPRAAVVYNLAADHFLRLSAGIAFRKPSIMETSTNLKIDANPAFPEIKQLFEEEGISNPALGNENWTTVGVGYRGSLFGNSLRIDANTYICFVRNVIYFGTYIHFDQTSLGPRINIEKSQLGYENLGMDSNIVGLEFSIEGEPFDELTLFLRGNLRHKWLIADASRDAWMPRMVTSTGFVLRCPFGFIAHLALVHVGERTSFLLDPSSALAPSTQFHIPDRSYLLAALTYHLPLGSSRLDVGLSFFNPFGGRLREAQGTVAPDGSTYGGEVIDHKAILTARLRY
jgi:outer membrane receptor protein involved in Fe transport